MVRQRIQQLEDPMRKGHDAIFEANYLEDIPAALEEWKSARVLLVVSTTLDTKSSLISDLEGRLSQYTLSKKTGVGSHSPYADVIDIAHRVQNDEVDAVVCIGSGSYSDACKIGVMMAATLHKHFTAEDMEAIVDQERGLAGPDKIKAPTTKLICVPTSLSAGEWNAFASASNKDGKKQHFLHPKGSPSLLLLDPNVASTTPAHLWLASGIRAVDHFVENLCHPKCNPEAAAHIKKGLPILVKGLNDYHIGQEKGDKEALLTGIAESQVGARDAILTLVKWWLTFGPSHAIGHQLGSVAGVQHGVTSCVILPATLQYTRPKTQDAQATILNIFNEVLGYQETDAGDAIRRFVRQLGLPSTLTEVGVTEEEQLRKVAENTLTDVVAVAKGLPDFDGIMAILKLAR